MSRPLRAGLVSALAALTLLAGCSTVEKLNPFSSSAPKVKPTELAAIGCVRQRLI